MSCVIAGDRGIAALRFAGDLSYHQCSIFLPSLGPIRAVGGGERSQCVGSWMGCVAEVAEPRASPRHRPVGPVLRCVGLWAQSRPSAHIRACCRACGASTKHASFCHFNKGISLVSQWTGREYKNMEKIFLGVIAGTTDEQVIQAVRAVVDFISYARFKVHTEISLERMDRA